MLKIVKTFGRYGLRPEPHWRELTALPRPRSWFGRGLLPSPQEHPSVCPLIMKNPKHAPAADVMWIKQQRISQATSDPALAVLQIV